MMSEMISDAILRSLLAEDLQLGFVDCNSANTLSFAENEHSLEIGIENPCIVKLLVSPELSVGSKATKLIPCFNPRREFVKLQNLLPDGSFDKSDVACDLVIGENSFVAPLGVVIGKNVIIGRNVSIYSGVRIEDGCKIGDNVVIGSESFFTANSRSGFLNMKHRGGVVIEENVTISNFSSIEKALFVMESTVIGSETLIGPFSSISHGATLGRRNFMAAGVLISGYTRLGEDNWVGPGVRFVHKLSIGNNNHIGIGSVIYKDLGSNYTIVNGRGVPTKSKLVADSEII